MIKRSMLLAFSVAVLMALPAVAQDTVHCEEGLRAVEDAVGESICVPEHPERIAALMEMDLDSLLALGITPIATTNGRGQPTAPRYLLDQAADVPIVGAFYSPNLEAVLALQPDLILMGGFGDETVLAQLSAIAPTVNTFVVGETWQTQFQRVAAVVNKQAEAEAFIAAYDARVDGIKGALGEDAPKTVSITRWNPDGPGIMLRDAFSSRVLADLGIERPANQQGEGVGHTPPLSMEDLQQIDADWLFIGTLASEGDAADAMAVAMDEPLFQALDSVKSEHFTIIDGSLWTSIGGPLAAHAVLDDVVDALGITESVNAEATPTVESTGG